MGSAFRESSLVYSGFKLPTRPAHYGTDLHPYKAGKKVNDAKVCATSKQTVDFAGWTTSGYGNLVRTTDGKYKHYYAHLSAVLVKTGDVLNEGQVLGVIGTTGNSTGIHLHYEVREWPYTSQAQHAINPSDFCAVKNVNGTTYKSTIGDSNGSNVDTDNTTNGSTNRDKFAIGREINLNNITVYASAYDKKSAGKLPNKEKGVVNPFYIHGAVINNRIPITNKLEFANKEITGENTTGYIAISNVPD